MEPIARWAAPSPGRPEADRTDEPPQVEVLPYATTLHQAAGEARDNHLDPEDGWEDDGEGQWVGNDQRYAHVVELVWDTN